MKVAICSTDGITVNQHFGKAEKFMIFEIIGCGMSLVGQRKVAPYCKEANEEGHTYNEDNLNRVYNVLSDCECLYTSNIGEKPLAEIEQRGIKVQVCNCPIKDISTCGSKCNYSS